jgi:hypothetical protein
MRGGLTLTGQLPARYDIQTFPETVTRMTHHMSPAKRGNRRAAFCMIAIAIGALHSTVSRAGTVYFTVPDASQIYYLSADDRVYLRNLTSFASGPVGGIATYWIDLSSQTGKALFAILLASAGRSSPMMLGAPDSGGAVTIGGYWYN